VPDAVAHGAALSAREKYQQHLQGLELVRAMRRQVIMPGAIILGAAVSACGKCQQHLQAYIFQVRCGAMPSCRM